MRNSKYTIRLAPAAENYKKEDIQLWSHADNEESANFAFNTLLSAADNKDVPYKCTMYMYDYSTDPEYITAAVRHDVPGFKVLTMVKRVIICNGVQTNEEVTKGPL